MDTFTQVYRQKIGETDLELSRLKTLNVVLVVSKLVVVAVLLFVGYKWISTHQTLFMVAILACAAFFALLHKFDGRFLHRLKFLKQFNMVLHNEIGALKGDYSPFSCGTEYLSADHPYAVDLDLFARGGLFAALNRTVTVEGKHELAQWLQKTDVAKQMVVERQEAVACLKDQVDWRLKFVAIGLLGHLTMAPLILHFRQTQKIGFRTWHKFMFLGLVGAAMAALIGNMIGLWGYFGWLLLFCINLFVIVFWLREINFVYRALTGTSKVAGNYHDLLMHIHSNKANLNKRFVGSLVTNLVAEEHHALEAFDKLRKLLASFDRRGNVLVTVALNGFLLNDIFLLMRYNKWMDIYASRIECYNNAIAQLDVLVSLGNFAYNHPDFSIPQVVPHTIMDAKALGHPLIMGHERVCNDFSIDRMNFFYITTGANMAGKSTFLRTVGVNMVLAACGAPVCAESFAFMPMAMFSSMRTVDNLEKHVSYFQAELLRLGALVELAKTGQPVFVVLDEILKGTNSKDKLEGSRVFLLKMMEYNVSGIIATHDLALGDLETEFPCNYQNICFEVHVKHDQLQFDYKLQKGVAQNMNATWLLNRMLQDNA
ncbi:MAG: hypothetical protein QM786_09710 [Breznakibacter sp.]